MAAIFSAENMRRPSSYQWSSSFLSTERTRRAIAASLRKLSATRVRLYSCGYDFAIRHLPQQYWKKVWSTKLLERVTVLRKLSGLNSLTWVVLPGAAPY